MLKNRQAFDDDITTSLSGAMTAADLSILESNVGALRAILLALREGHERDGRTANVRSVSLLHVGAARPTEQGTH